MDINNFMLTTETENPHALYAYHHHHRQNENETTSKPTQIYTNLFDSMQLVFDENSNATSINIVPQQQQQKQQSQNTPLLYQQPSFQSSSFDNRHQNLLNSSSTTTTTCNSKTQTKHSKKNRKIKERTKCSPHNSTLKGDTKKKKNSTTITNKNVQLQHNLRVHRYCPTAKQMNLKLKCEWCECKSIFDDMDKFLQHILGEHLKTISVKEISFLIIILNRRKILHRGTASRIFFIPF